MTTIAILPVVIGDGSVTYCGVAGEKRSQGDTIGKALDALTLQLPEIQDALLVVVQSLRPDRFFNAEQQRRLGELMGAWREARDGGADLPSNERAELETLIEAELRASGDRAAMLASLPRVEARGTEKLTVQGT